MADEKTEVKEDRADADGDKLDKIMDALGTINSRIDKMEAADAAKCAADAAEGEEPKDDAAEDEGEEPKDDAAEDEEPKDDAAEDEDVPGKPLAVAADKKRKDKARKDAEEEDKKAIADALNPIQERIARVEAALPKRMTEEERAAMTEIQAKADQVYHAFGDAAPRPLEGETPFSYRKRLAGKLQEHSSHWKSAKLHAIADEPTFDAIEGQIYADAMTAAMRPASPVPGSLRAVTRSEGGHTITDYVGEPRAWMDPIAGGTRQFVTSIATPSIGSK